MTKRGLDLLLVQIPNLREPSYLVGVASLKAYLTKHGHSVVGYNPVGDAIASNSDFRTPAIESEFSNEGELFDTPFSTDLATPVIERFSEKIRKTKPRFIGFSIIYGNIRSTLGIAAEIKRRFPESPLLLGGPGLKVKRFVLHPQDVFDVLVQGEAEEPLNQLLSEARNFKDPHWPKGLKNFDYRTPDGAWHKNPHYAERLDLVGFPQPDYGDFESDPCAKLMLTARPLSLGRGCPFRCRFCAVKNYGAAYRHYTIEDCVNYIRHHMELGRTHFFVHDPITNGNPKWLRRFCQTLINEKLDIRWGGSLRLEKYLVESETLDLLAASGFHMMITGLESAAPNVLRHMKKFEEMDSVDKIFEKIRTISLKYPFTVCLQLIIGYPNETESDFQLSLNFVKRHRDVIKEIVSCSTFLAIQSENDDLREMIENHEFGMHVKTEVDWFSLYSTPAIRLDRMNRAEACFKELGLPYRMFYRDHLERIRAEK